VGATMGVVGAILLIHGATRVSRVRHARRRMALSGATLELDRGRATFVLSARF
jgi:hypothetical protein